MDSFLHILLAIPILGFYYEVLIGAILPDALYLIAGVIYRFDVNKIKKSRIFIWGERMHSLLLLPIILTVVYITWHDIRVLLLLASVYLHILTDILTHRDFGPRFLWPLVDTYYPRGIIQWEDRKSLVALYFIVFCILFVRLLVRYR